MEKKSNRTNVLTESIQQNTNTSFIHAILNAIMKGYSDKTVFVDIVELVRLNQITDGVLNTTPAILRSYAKEFSKSLIYIADKLEKIAKYRKETKVNTDVEVEEHA